MTDITGTSVPSEPTIWTGRTAAAGGVLAALVIGADLLVWQHEPGISLFIFFFSLSVGVLALYPHKLGQARTVALFMVALLGALPFVETLSPLALLSAQGGVTLLALGVADKLPRFEDWGGALARFGLLAPFRLIGDGIRMLAEGGQKRVGGRMMRGAAAWIVPLVFAALFVLLFSAANPLVEAALRAIQLDRLLELLQPGRVILWAMVACFAWPFLQPVLLNWVTLPQMQGPLQPRAESLLFGRAAILNSLVLFNALFATQTFMDLLYLWGGLRLPAGMTNAEYAHRGAYPLIVTAILAGAFVLAAMREGGPGRTSVLIRTLVYVWVAQNVWLVISSILRLKLYVEEYQLSELRVVAGIWMLLVGIGLVLIVAKIALGRSNRWLVMSNMAVLSVTLWGVAFIDLQSLIARYNVGHSLEVTGHGLPLDIQYMSDLGPAAIPALDEFVATARFATEEQKQRFSTLRAELALIVLPVDEDSGRLVAQPLDWREWTWRVQRLRDYLIERDLSVDTAPSIE